MSGFGDSAPNHSDSTVKVRRKNSSDSSLIIIGIWLVERIWRLLFNNMATIVHSDQIYMVDTCWLQNDHKYMYVVVVILKSLGPLILLLLTNPISAPSSSSPVPAGRVDMIKELYFQHHMYCSIDKPLFESDPEALKISEVWVNPSRVLLVSKPHCLGQGHLWGTPWGPPEEPLSMGVP